MPKDKKPDESKSDQSKRKVEKPEAPPPVQEEVVVPRPGTFPPIVINFNPAISSLSPTDAVVGGGDLDVSGGFFTLAVFGSNFNSNSTVNWNQSGRPTTFISATQLTAQITTADISVIGPATVTVVNQGLGRSLVSNSVTFNVIQDISSIINQLQSIPAPLLNDLKTWATLEHNLVVALKTQVSTDNTTIANLSSQNQNLNVTIQQQKDQIAQLQAALAAAKGATASPLDVAQSFKSVVDQIQQQARDAGGVQTTLTNMNVQLKTLISVQPQSGTTPPQAVLGFPDLTAPPDANLLSTMTLAFGAIPNVKPPGSAPPSVSGVPPRPAASAVPSSSAPSAPAPSSSPAAPSPATSAPAARVGASGEGTSGPAPAAAEKSATQTQPSPRESPAKKTIGKTRRSGKGS